MYRATFLAIAALLLAACGSGSLDVKPLTTVELTATPTPRPTVTPVSTPQRSGTPVTAADLAPFVKSYVKSTWNYLTGVSTARALYDLFTPECQRMVSLTSMERSPALVQALYRGLQGKNVEEVEFAIPLALSASSESLQLRTPLTSQTRIRVDGTSLTVYEWLYAMNPASTTDKTETLVVKAVGDSFRIASCEGLRQWDQQR